MITIFVTGGTFDKEYDEISGKLFFKDTHVSEMLELGRCKIPMEITPLMLKDSLDMSAEDREVILRACEKSESEQILITHGTDTMVQSAQLLGKHIKNKTVVFTGAMVPYKFGSSDGMFNLGSALALVQTLQPGVYIAMNGRIFPWDNVQKNRERGEFEEIY